MTPPFADFLLLAYSGGCGTTDGWALVVDPKRIQRRLRITQNSLRQLRTLRMASADKEREKIQSSQNLVKMA
jgi:hypothetical protein